MYLYMVYIAILKSLFIEFVICTNNTEKHTDSTRFQVKESKFTEISVTSYRVQILMISGHLDDCSVRVYQSLFSYPSL